MQLEKINEVFNQNGMKHSPPKQVHNLKGLCSLATVVTVYFNVHIHPDNPHDSGSLCSLYGDGECPLTVVVAVVELCMHMSSGSFQHSNQSCHSTHIHTHQNLLNGLIQLIISFLPINSLFANMAIVFFHAYNISSSYPVYVFSIDACSATYSVFPHH